MILNERVVWRILDELAGIEVVANDGDACIVDCEDCSLVGVICETVVEANGEDVTTGSVEIVEKALADNVLILIDGVVERRAGVADPEVGIE